MLLQRGYIINLNRCNLFAQTANRRRGQAMERSAFKRYTLMLLGVIMVSFAISAVYTPNKIVSGGVSGFATVLYHSFGIAPGLSFAIINAVLLGFAYKFLGFDFVRNTIVGAALVTVFVQLFTYVPPVTNDVFLATVFGAIIYGVGIGLTLVSGGSTGGTDILGRLVQCAFPHVKIGTLLLVVDAAVIGIAVLVFKNVDLTLYGIIALFISSVSVNFLISKLNLSKLAFVISRKGIEVSHYLVSHSQRGVTIINAIGAYTMDSKQVLICAIKENEMPRFQTDISDIDPQAFIIFSESQQIIGNGFRVYK